MRDVTPRHPDHSNQLARLRRVEGQVRGISAMIADGRYCIDIVDQLQAARAALARVERDVLERHAAACVTDAIASGDTATAQARLAELTRLLKRSMR